MQPRARILLVTSIVCGWFMVAGAQWIQLPTPGIPRTSEGGVDLNAPAPRTTDGRPDLSGMWGWQPGRFFGSLTQDLQAGGDQALGARARRRTGIEHMGRTIHRTSFACRRARG